MELCLINQDAVVILFLFLDKGHILCFLSRLLQSRLLGLFHSDGRLGGPGRGQDLLFIIYGHDRPVFGQNFILILSVIPGYQFHFINLPVVLNVRLQLHGKQILLFLSRMIQSDGLGLIFCDLSAEYIHGHGCRHHPGCQAGSCCCKFSLHLDTSREIACGLFLFYYTYFSYNLQDTSKIFRALAGPISESLLAVPGFRPSNSQRS